jgi:CRISPR/Cas system CSM-associated protein Csm3 (group 7 of RAMP superfamily)
MTLKCEIKFLDYWHISSGNSGGAKLDSYVIRDKNNLPYISGKTIKGLVREMADSFEDSEFIKECFGLKGVDMGKCYFTDALLSQDIQSEIIKDNLQDYLYHQIASTKITKDGLAEDNSLREIEVVVPLTLYAKVKDVPSEFSQKLISSFMMVKRAGLNRNRGLGRCQITVEEQI